MTSTATLNYKKPPPNYKRRESTPFPEFQPWPKIARWNRPVQITEKIDGTNACVVVHVDDEGRHWVGAQSRTRMIRPGKGNDNFGFAEWVQDHAEELALLGKGHHYGEWFGQGIQRGYGLAERRFALFNADRWDIDSRPSCCHVVPVLAQCSMPDAQGRINDILIEMKRYGSMAVTGFMKPEGIVIYQYAGHTSHKITFDGDGDASRSRNARL